MLERLTDKTCPPSQAEIEAFIGPEGRTRLSRLEAELSRRYALGRELRFPFGKPYGWGYKYSHRTKHLFYVFFEQGAFTVTLQLGGREAAKLAEKLGTMLPKTRLLWADRYPCGDGGWIHYRVENDGELEDILALTALRQKPV